MLQAIPTGTPGVSNIGMVKIRTIEALEAEKAAKVATSAPNLRVIDSVNAHLSRLLFSAKRAKDPIERQMLKNMRQVYGEYEPGKLAAIRKMGGSEVYVLLTMTKYRAAIAWINDILRATGGERMWAALPTPCASLPPNVEGQIKSEGEELFQMVQENLAALGMMTNPEYIQEEIQKYENEVRDKTQLEIQKEAKKRCERMSLRIDDQMVEGGWDATFWAVISDLVMLKAGIIKGPVIRRRPVHTWVEKDGDWQMDVQDKLVPEFDRVSPFDWFPLSGATSIKDGGFERHHLTRSDLVAMIGVPGYREKNIRAALTAYASGRREILPTDTQLAQLRDGQTQSLIDSDRIEAWEFWGSLQGSLLQQWGIPVADAELEYEVNAWTVGEYTIRLLLNPDKLGRKPYAVDSFERVPGAFWGKGLPELMTDVQDVCNATARAIVNNAGLASGPQVEVDKSRCGDQEEIWPWKIWPSTNAQMSEAPAIRFTQPTIVVQPLLQVFQTFSGMADDQTGVPKWAHGDSGVGGAGNTSSGLSMLMTYAARGIKEVIAHVDTMVADVVGRTYDYNMLYDPDKSIKGDARVVARGSSSLLAKEQRLVRTNEFLNSTNNPVDIQIMGLPGRAKLLRTAAKLLDIDTEGVIPDSDSEIEKLTAMIAQAEAAGISPPGGSQPGSGKAPAPKPQTTDPSGAPSGGTDTNAFQNQEGVRT